MIIPMKQGTVSDDCVTYQPHIPIIKHALFPVLQQTKELQANEIHG